MPPRQQFKTPRPKPQIDAHAITHYDVSFRKVTDKGESFFVKVGVAFPNASGEVVVSLDALPLNTWDGKLWLFPKASAKTTASPAETAAEPA